MSDMNLKLDDPGYGSPVVKGSQEKAILYLKRSNSKSSDMVTARNEDTLADVLLQSQKYSMENVKNMLIWAEIRNHTGPKWVNPFLLRCGFIQPNTEVEIEYASKDKVVCKDDIKLESAKLYSTLQGSVFFVSISNRKNKQAITNVHYEKLRYRDVCVFASPDESFREAFLKDSRFVNVDNFTLQKKVLGAGQGATIGMDTKPADFREIVVEVIVNKAAQSKENQKKSNNPMASTGETATSDADTAKRSETSGKKQRSLNELYKKLWEERAVYLFSKKDLTNQEVLSERQECLRARAWYTLLGPEERAQGMKNLEKSLEKLAKVQFANNIIASRPVRFTKTLCKLYNSIGQLKCGSIVATCFLVSANLIATNNHVVDMIITARNSSTHYSHSDVYIDFDYETEKSPSGRKLKPLAYKGNILSTAFDYAFLFLEECVEEKLTLGDSVRCNVPERGMVCIVGHPGDKEKQDELCPILPLHADRRALEIERRYRENESRCINNESSCALACVGQVCVHLYKGDLEKLCDKTAAVTYDVGSMFEGSSGAPVFDMKCNIIGLHTGGFRLGETSVVEYAVTFRAIVEDLLNAGYSEFVEMHFPCYNQQDMETEDSQ